MRWEKFTKRTMPPEDTQILIWIDFHHYGFAVCGVYSCEEITYASNWHGITRLDRSDWRDARWALIDPPEGAII